MHIREAGPEDWPPVASLLAELGRPDVAGTEEEDAARGVFERYLDRADTRSFVAEDRGRVIGFIDMELRTRLNFTAPQAWIPDLVSSVPTPSTPARAGPSPDTRSRRT